LNEVKSQKVTSHVKDIDSPFISHKRLFQKEAL